MLTHQHIWNALDQLADHYSLSPSALAKKAGLDSTTFNKSKRTSLDGRLRWPSTESIAKALEATGATLDDFLRLVAKQGAAPRQTLPLIGFAQAGSGGFLMMAVFRQAPAGTRLSFPM